MFCTVLSRVTDRCGGLLGHVCILFKTVVCMAMTFLIIYGAKTEFADAVCNKLFISHFS